MADIDTGNFDTGNDRPSLARIQLLEVVQRTNQIRIASIGTTGMDTSRSGMLAQIKSETYVVGQQFISPLYGGSTWVVKSSVVLQDPQNSTVTFDDELHLQVALYGGGVGVAECQTGSVAEYCKQLHNDSYARAIAGLRQSSRGTVTSLACYGDSITFGQYTGFPGAVPKVGTATGFGDGSVHAHDQHPQPWPEILRQSLVDVYGAGSVTVFNRGYSGDRIGSGYCRHRVGAGQLVAFVEYGTNDVLYGSTNGTAPDMLFADASNYAMRKFLPAYRKFVLREMLRGSVVILVTPGPFSSLTGYDGTSFASAKILAYYVNAIHALGNELGVAVVDAYDIIGNMTQNVLVDGVHLATGGHSLRGKRLAAMLVGRGFRWPEVIVGERRLNASILHDSLEGMGQSEIVGTPNLGSFGKRFYSLTESEDVIVLAGSSLYWSVYLEEDAKSVMPIGYLQSGGKMTWSIDFDADGAFEKLRVDPLGMKGEMLAPATSKTVISAIGVRDINHASQFADPVVIQGRGWHTIKLQVDSGAFVCSGLRFWGEPDYWRPLALSSGMAVFGDIQPAWTVRAGTLLFRGSIVSSSPSIRTKLFDLPAETIALMPGNITTASVTFPWTRVAVSLESGAIFWDANVGHSTNLLNLENIRIPLSYLPIP